LISRLKIRDEKTSNRLLILLNHEEELIRRISAILLTELGTVEALNAVVAGNTHGHAIRTQAAWKLKEMGKKASPAIPGLISLLRYKKINWRTHSAAQSALSEMGESAESILIALLDDDDETMQEHARIILEMIKPSKNN
jgi:HEAT repeat protein